jgi:hypothetical protein
MADELAARKATSSKAEFDRTQQLYGLTYHPAALPWDLPLRQHYFPVTSVYWDWMHIYCTSSGIVQYQLNSMCLDIIEQTGVTLERLDSMLSLFVAANRTQMRPLGSNFLSKHVVKAHGSHLKGFAGDTLTVLCFLNFFCLRTLIPKDQLVAKARSVCRAYDIICLLRTGDAAVGRATELATMISEYHAALSNLWGLEIMKIKSHLQFHLPRCLATVGFGLACWSNERRNRLLIKTARHYTHAGGKSSESSASILCRLVLDLQHRVETSSFVEHELIFRRGKAPRSTPEFAAFLPDGILKTSIFTSHKARFGNLVLVAGDILLLDGQAYCVVEMCAQALEEGTFSNRILVVVRTLQLVAGHGCNLYSRTDQVRFVDIRRVHQICLRVDHGDGIVEPIGPA